MLVFLNLCFALPCPVNFPSSRSQVRIVHHVKSDCAASHNPQAVVSGNAADPLLPLSAVQAAWVRNLGCGPGGGGGLCIAGFQQALTSGGPWRLGAGKPSCRARLGPVRQEQGAHCVLVCLLCMRKSVCSLLH